LAGDGADVENMSFFLRKHCGNEGAGKVVGAEEIDVHHKFELVVGFGEEGALHEKSGVVDEHIYGFPIGFDKIGESEDFVFLA